MTNGVGKAPGWENKVASVVLGQKNELSIFKSYNSVFNSVIKIFCVGSGTCSFPV